MRHFAFFFFALCLLLFSLVPSCQTYCDQHPSDPQCTPQFGPSPTSTGTTNSCDVQPSGASVQLPVQYMQQECDELCWAATIKMVASYYGQLYTECQYATEKVLLETNTQYNCCQGPSACYDQYCNRTATPQEMSYLMSNALYLQNTLVGSPISEAQLQNELTNGRPVIIGFVGPFSGHVAVISGYQPASPAMYYVEDPWPSYGQFFTDYYSIVQGPNEHWSMTFYNIHPAGQACR